MRRRPKTTGSAAWRGGEGRGRGRGGDDCDYYNLTHVRRAAARPIRRIRHHSEVVLVDAPLDDNRRKRIRRMGR
jgi:hypothetical protein